MENYKEKYENLIEKLKKAKEEHGGYTFSSVIDKIVPELHESDDEKIRKGLIKGLSAMRDIHKHQTFSDDAINIDDAISWLEKQGKNKDQNNRIYIQKFNIGDTVYRQGWSDNTIEKIYNDGKFEPVYICKNEEGLESHISFSEQDEWKLKDRMQSQPKQEWGEEDNKNLNSVKWIIENSENLNRIFETINSPEYIKKYFIDWLKSLKPNHWKPSEEQMETLKFAANDYCMGETKKNLESLYNDLKKL